MSVEKRLFHLKAKIEEHKKEKAEAQGAMKQLLKDLQGQGAKDPQDAVRKIKKLNLKLNRLMKEIETGTKELELKYELA